MSSAKQIPFVSVIIPCYNEENNLKRGVLEDVRQYLEKQAYHWEVIVVDDESTDNSKYLIEQFISDTQDFYLFDIPHGGKPAAVWAGIRKATGEIVLFIDMDQSTPIKELDRLLPWYGQGFDVVIGSRGSVRSGYSFLRKAGSFVFLNFRRLFLLHSIRDTQCGFKSARRQAALEIFPRLQFFENAERPAGWKVTAYDVELLYLFERAGFRIKEVDVDWFNRDESDTKGKKGEVERYIHESVDMVKELVNIKLRQFRGGYNK
jgi:dolichyl-phosphate beta-glucosyltransferase